MSEYRKRADETTAEERKIFDRGILAAADACEKALSKYGDMASIASREILRLQYGKPGADAPYCWDCGKLRCPGHY